MDAKLLALCSAHQISYTRYADDLSFSGESIECVEDIKAIIAQYGFIINDKKTRIYTHRYPTSIKEFKRDKGLHPTQKPVALLGYLIKTYTNENELVLDSNLKIRNYNNLNK